MKYLVEATNKYIAKRIWDSELSKQKSEEEGKVVKYYPTEGEQWKVSFERKEILVNKGFVREIKAIEEDIEEVQDIEAKSNTKKGTTTKKKPSTKKKE